VRTPLQSIHLPREGDGQKPAAALRLYYAFFYRTRDGLHSIDKETGMPEHGRVVGPACDNAGGFSFLLDDDAEVETFSPLNLQHMIFRLPSSSLVCIGCISFTLCPKRLHCEVAISVKRQEKKGIGACGCITGTGIKLRDNCKLVWSRRQTQGLMTPASASLIPVPIGFVLRWKPFVLLESDSQRSAFSKIHLVHFSDLKEKVMNVIRSRRQPDVKASD
jgi:hypothetical protein